MKTKYIRANNSPFMNKELSKAIMVRSRLRNKSIKLKTIQSRQAYNKQRNFCVTLLGQVKKDFYENLNPALISDNKKFWKQVKPFFSDKTPSSSNIMLSEGKEINSDPTQCADIFNNFFIDSIKNLDTLSVLNFGRDYFSPILNFGPDYISPILNFRPD